MVDSSENLYWQQALNLYEMAQGSWRQLLTQSDPESIRAAYLLSQSLVDASRIHTKLGESAAALRAVDGAIEIAEKRQWPEDFAVAEIYLEKADLLDEVDPAEAEHAIENALRILNVVAQRDQLSWQDLTNVGRCYQNVGWQYDTLGKHDHARRAGEKSLELLRSFGESPPPMTLNVLRKTYGLLGLTSA